MSMPKLSKQQRIIYGIIAVLVVVCIYLYATPEQTSTSHTQVVVTSTSQDQTTYDPADDTNAHFPRYVGSSRDPFIPGVSLNDGQTSGSGSMVSSGKWALTGINTIDGTTTALIENSGTSESDFVKVGDTWNGLKVVAISDNSVAFVNALGLPTQLGFAAPPTPTDQLNAGLNQNTPSINQIMPLPPLSPGASNRALRAYFQNGGQQ
jgi:hypothetical protein